MIDLSKTWSLVFASVFLFVCFFTSSHHLVLHGRMCSDCAAVPDAMCQQSNGTCRRAKHLLASCDKVTLSACVAPVYTV